MNECPSNSSAPFSLDWKDYWSRIRCILTYGATNSNNSHDDLVVAQRHMWLNYGLLLVNIAVCAQWLWQRRGDEFHRFTPAVGSLLFAVAFQIVLCWQLGCSGISIVWCACLGWFLYKSQWTPEIPHAQSQTTATNTTRPPSSSTATDTLDATMGTDNNNDVTVLYESPDTSLSRNRQPYTCLQIYAGLLNLALILYYFLTAPLITTAAHLCAILMGMMLALSEECCQCRQPRDDNDNELQSTNCFGCHQWIFLDNFLASRTRRRPASQQEESSTDNNNTTTNRRRPSRADDPLLASSSNNLFASPEESFVWGSARRSSSSARKSSSSWLFFSTILCCLSLPFQFAQAADETTSTQAENTTDYKPKMIDITCPPSLDKSENDFDGYWETYLEMNQDNLQDLENFRLRGFDYRVHAYWQLKHMMKLWKHAYLGNVIRNGDAIYESASGQGLNLLLTLEILHEEVQLSNVTVYGNDYLTESVALSHQLLEYAKEPWFHKGSLCQGDSTDLAHVPDNAFDFAYTGFIDPLVDPLNLLGGMATLQQAEHVVRHLCTSDDELHQDLIELMQEKQNEWFAKWVTELVRIVKPGGYIVVEDIGWPMCNGAHEEWGGVDTEWWKEAIQDYDWDVYPESIDVVESPWYGDRYNIRMRKRTTVRDESTELEYMKQIQKQSKEIYDANYIDWMDWGHYWGGRYTEEFGEDYLLQYPEYEPKDEEDYDDDEDDEISDLESEELIDDQEL